MVWQIARLIPLINCFTDDVDDDNDCEMIFYCRSLTLYAGFVLKFESFIWMLYTYVIHWYLVPRMTLLCYRSKLSRATLIKLFVFFSLFKEADTSHSQCYHISWHVAQEELQMKFQQCTESSLLLSYYIVGMCLKK